MTNKILSVAAAGIAVIGIISAKTALADDKAVSGESQHKAHHPAVLAHRPTNNKPMGDRGLMEKCQKDMSKEECKKMMNQTKTKKKNTKNKK